MDVLKKGLEFNSSVFKSHQEDVLKFLQDMKPEEGQHAGYLFKSAKPVIGLTIAYVLFVKVAGPWLMSFREPFALKSIIRFYNLLMVILAAILVKELYTAAGSLNSFFSCDKVFDIDDGNANHVYQLSNFILTVRVCEYLDTVFFTLRKKQNQVTFLHVFHHAFVPIYGFFILRTCPARYNTFIMIINSFVHVIMYFYYFIATFQDKTSNETKAKPKNILLIIVDQLLVYKKYVTQLQILQFVVLAFYATSVVTRPNRCNVTWTYFWANLLLASTFLILFLHFYFNVYKKVSTSKRNKKD